MELQHRRGHGRPRSLRAAMWDHGVTALMLISVAAFVVAAGVAVWAAYDRGPAARKFVLLAGGLALILLLPAVARLSQRRVPDVAWALCIPLALGLAVHGLASRPEARDAAAGALAIVLPLSAAGLLRVRAALRRLDLQSIAACLSMILGLLAVARSGEGAAWAGLAGAGLFATWAGGTGRRGQSWLRPFAGVLLATGALGLALASVVSAFPFIAVARLPLPAHASSRLMMWHDALALVQDYAFTGSGLASTGMVLSSYVWLLHVPFAGHVHHLFLQIAIEQGIVGCAAFTVMLATSGWCVARRLADRDPDRHHRAVAAGASLVALVVYGLAESDVYASPLVPVLFVPAGFAWMLSAGAPKRTGVMWSRRSIVAAGGLMVAAIAGLAIWCTRSAQFQANLGAVAQARAELSVYEWPEWGVQDRLRRELVVDLEPAIAHYRTALALDPHNVTALRRLGQIELSRGNYTAARALLTRAYGLAPHQRATRQMLGELAALDGDIDRAAGLWATVGNEYGQLDGRAWWYGQVGTAEEQQRIRQALARVGPTR